VIQLNSSDRDLGRGGCGSGGSGLLLGLLLRFSISEVVAFDCVWMVPAIALFLRLGLPPFLKIEAILSAPDELHPSVALMLSATSSGTKRRSTCSYISL
jgi:hypothetical protein